MKFNASMNGLEASFNKSGIFVLCLGLYVVAFCMSAVAWIKWGKLLNFAAFQLIAFTFAIHTIALVSRMAISGRPPVTNLYSSAVFIGWGVVGLGLALEWLYKIGLGNVVAAVSGFATLLIAKWLSVDGDTMEVLVAVLDTQFWLATHVTCITFGYSTMFLAGALGIGYLVRSWMGNMTPELGKEITRMTYGVVCFAIFFSFVGTVLGGLWADDSWGRFWGWDPKENGALMIVIWNAIVLHARWGGLVKERGMALLAVGGNIVTAWSWFGVNELGVGLHSYGFTEGRLFYLGLFTLSQLIVLGLGVLPNSVWGIHGPGSGTQPKTKTA